MNKKKTHEQFLEDLWDKNKHYRDGELIIVGSYSGSKSKIEVVTRYGNCSIAAGMLLKNQLPKIDSAINKTEYFKNMCLEKFGDDGNDDLSQVEYVSNVTKIIVIDREFGLYATTPNIYYSGARSMVGANSKMSERVRRDKEDVMRQVALFCPDVEILPFKYINQTQKILVKDKYGVCETTIFRLLKGVKLTIQTAIDKRAYFEAQARCVHGELYNYSLVEYKGHHVKVDIIGPNGVFKQTPNNHLSGYGCQILGKEKVTNYNKNNPTGWAYTNWKITAEKSKNFTGYKVYFLECWNENERFYKIGRTYKGVGDRFKHKTSMPYSYKVLHTIELDDPKRICELEQEYKNKHKEYKYLPTKKFNGMHECFSQLIYF